MNANVIFTFVTCEFLCYPKGMELSENLWKCMKIQIWKGMEEKKLGKWTEMYYGNV